MLLREAQRHIAYIGQSDSSSSSQLSRHDVILFSVVSAKASLMIVLKVALQRPQVRLQPRHL
jgi:hypothetical protein